MDVFLEGNKIKNSGLLNSTIKSHQTAIRKQQYNLHKIISVQNNVNNALQSHLCKSTFTLCLRSLRLLRPFEKNLASLQTYDNIDSPGKIYNRRSNIFKSGGGAHIRGSGATELGRVWKIFHFQEP